MMEGTGLGAKLVLSALPILDEALEFASMGMVPGGAHKNRSFRSSMVDVSDTVEGAMRDILYDPQTSGGLCIAVKSDSADAMVKHLHDDGIEFAAVIGEVVDHPAGRIEIL
jgi:selenide,water dikinase